jgi:GT2 family glycosyltransferase
VAFNDVDFCLLVRAQGYRIVWTPHAELYHLESASRGSDIAPEKMERRQREIDYMQSRRGSVLSADPFYNPNLRLDDTMRASLSAARGKAVAGIATEMRSGPCSKETSTKSLTPRIGFGHVKFTIVGELAGNSGQAGTGRQRGRLNRRRPDHQDLLIV